MTFQTIVAYKIKGLSISLLKATILIEICREHITSLSISRTRFRPSPEGYVVLVVVNDAKIFKSIF